MPLGLVKGRNLCRTVVVHQAREFIMCATQVEAKKSPLSRLIVQGKACLLQDVTTGLDALSVLPLHEECLDMMQFERVRDSWLDVLGHYACEVAQAPLVLSGVMFSMM